MGKSQYIDPVNLRKLRDRIQDIISTKKIPIDALADRTGFTPKQVYRIIYGKGNTSISNIFSIAGAMEIHIMEFFIIDFQIPAYDTGMDFYRINNKAIRGTEVGAKPMTAANAIRSLIDEGYFNKANNTLEEKTINKIVRDCQQRFRPDFKTSEFSSALIYAVKTNTLKRYKQNGTKYFVYHI